METKTIDRKALAVAIHQNAVDKGFWDNDLSDNHYLMLTISELSEAVEAHRKGNRADREFYHNILTDGHIRDSSKHAYYISLKDIAESNDLPLWLLAFEDCIKDTVEDELADAYIRILDLAEARGITLRPSYAEMLNAFIKSDTSFTELAFGVVSRLIHFTDSLAGDLNQALDAIEAVCLHEDIDLLWHIEEKMKYNATRPRLHGKAY